MIKTKLIQLFYKVKNKTIKKKVNQFYKRKILTTGFAVVQKGKTKTRNSQHTATTKTSPSMASKFSIGQQNTHDPFQYSIISVFWQNVTQIAPRLQFSKFTML